MDHEEFRREAHRLVDWMARYLAEIERYPVRAQVRPGEIAARLPAAPPAEAEPFADIVADFERLVMPGMTHWQHPSFFAYFPANASPPSLLAEMLTATLAAQCMLWQTSPAATEMETTMKALGSIGGEDVKAASARLREVADTIAVTAARLDRLVAENQDNVDRFADQGLADFEQLVRETRSAVRSFDALSRSLEQDPSRVIYRPAPAGVEIPP